MHVALLLLLIFLPVAHGAVEVWSITVVHTVSVVILVLWLLSVVKKGHLKFYRTPLDLPVLMFLSLSTLSIFLSVNPYASRIQLFKIINYSVVFYMLVNTVREERRLFIITSVIAFFGAVYGITGLLLNAGNFLGFKIFSSDNYLSFTFKNHNHFAGYMEMITWLCVGVALSYKGARRIFFVSLSTASAVAVLLSLSRGGILGILGGLFFFSIVTAFCRSMRRNLYLIISFIAIGLIGTVMMGGLELVFNRMKTLRTPLLMGEDRLGYWKDTLKMIADNPWFGSGSGTFANAYSKYQSSTADYIIMHAHNGYLELAAEMGLTGVLSILLCITILFVYVLKRLIVMSDRQLQAVGLGALSACFSLLMHEFVDFNFYIPSNAMLFVVCAAIALISSTLDKNEKFSTWIDIQLTPKNKLPVYLSIFVLSLVLLTVVISPYIGNYYLNLAKKHQMAKNYGIAYREMKKAVFFDHGNAEHMTEMGDLMVMRSIDEKDIVKRDEYLLKSLKHYEDAIRACSISSYYSRKAYSLRLLGRPKETEDVLKKAVFSGPMNYVNHYALAEFYIEQGELRKAFEEYKISIQLLNNYEHMITILDKIWGVTDNYNDLKQVVPENTFMRNVFAQYLIKRGKKHAAMEELAFIFSLEPTLGQAENHLFWVIAMNEYHMAEEIGEKYLKRFGNQTGLLREMARVYLKLGRRDKAISSYQQLIEKEPVNASRYYIPHLADLYRNENRCYEAISILQKGLKDRPNNADLYDIMAGCYRDMKKPEEALKAQEKAVSLAPGDSVFRYRLGIDYMHNKLFKEAYEQLKKCIEINPRHELCMSQIGELEKMR